MTQTISITGLTNSNVLPGTYVELNFAAGDLTGDASVKKILLLGAKDSSGTASTDTIYGPDTPTSLTSASDAATLFGVNSELYAMYQKCSAANSGVNPIYVGVEPAASGNAATGTITLSGTTATANASIDLYIGEYKTTVAITSGDALATIATNCKNAINALQTVCTATNDAGVITLTYSAIGARGNDFRYHSRISNSCGITTSVTSSTKFTGGSGSPVLTSIIAESILDKYFYVACADGYNDQTGITALKASIIDQATPLKNDTRRLFVGWVGDYSTDLTARGNWISALNCERIEVLSLNKGDVIPGALAATAVGAFAQFESKSVPRCNFNGFGSLSPDSAYWLIKAPQSGAKVSQSQIISDLGLGVTPVVAQGKNTYVSKRCTTRYLLGTINDYRIREPHKVLICDLFKLDLQAILTALMQGKMISDNPPSGSVPSPNSVYPRLVKSKLIRLLNDYKDNDLLEDIKTSIDTAIIQRSSQVSSRLEMRVSLDVADILDQIVGQLNQVG